MPHPASPTPRPTRHRRNWLCFVQPLMRTIHHNPCLIKYLSRLSLRRNWLCFAESNPAPAAIPALPCVARSCPFEANWLCFARIARMKAWKSYSLGVIVALHWFKKLENEISRLCGPEVPARPPAGAQGLGRPSESPVRHRGIIYNKTPADGCMLCKNPNFCTIFAPPESHVGWAVPTTCRPAYPWRIGGHSPPYGNWATRPLRPGRDSAGHGLRCAGDSHTVHRLRPRHAREYARHHFERRHRCSNV
jgi:hypothetical protein